MAVAYDVHSGEKIMNASELIQKSENRTNEIKKKFRI
jgi:hypothetical protein